MRREDAFALVQRLVEAANRRDVAALVAAYAEDAVAVSPVFGEVRGRAAIAQTWDRIVSTFSDLVVEVPDVLVDGDRVAALGIVTAAYHSGWFGLAPAGGQIQYRLLLLCTVRDGLIVRDERIYDSVGIIERLEKARLDKELRTAADVQHALLGETAHHTSFSEFVGDSVPCRAIGGDFFEVVALPSGSVGIAMGDVAGKGPAAALLAALVQGMFVVEAHVGDGPAATMTRISQRLAARRLDARFVTFFYGVLSPDGGFIYTNAGHNAPVLLTASSTRRCAVGGPPLGTFADLAFHEESVRLNAGDTLVMFTDGVTEARNDRDEEFGDERLLNILALTPPTDLLAKVLHTVREFSHHAEPTDDITVAVLRFGPPAKR
jgi:sigma-B regulation protein RsbU (phosphoserine phosphatase)